MYPRQANQLLKLNLGDSGGPLVTAGSGNGVTPGQNYVLIGVTSWGNNNSCGVLSGFVR